MHGKCIGCWKEKEGRRVSDICAIGIDQNEADIPRILCDACASEWVWSHNHKDPDERHFYKRRPKVKYAHQDRLRRTLMRNANILGATRGQVHSEVGFPAWGVTEVHGLLRYDVAIPAIRLLVEYHGEQHYMIDNIHIHSQEELDAQMERDAVKAELARMKGYALVVFSFRDAVDNDQWVVDKVQSEMRLWRQGGR